MKRLISLLLLLSMIAVLMIPVSASELTLQPVACNHNWSETSSSAPTCTAPGEKKYTCSLCNEVKTESITSAGHTYGALTAMDDSVHNRTCTVCGVTESVAHDWGEGTVVSQATCTAEGSKTYTCACGRSKTQTVAKLEHTFSEWVKDAQSHERSCSICTNKESGSHSMKEETLKEATCKETGSRKKYCTVCGYNEMISIPKIREHSYDNVCDPDCNICGEKRNTSHSFSSSWSRDHTGHWHECTKCGEKVDFRSHYPGPAATESAPQLCLTCDYVIAQQKEHQHSYSKKWEKDESGHWYACASCEVKKDAGQHIYDSACDAHCNTCDFENPDAHDYGSGWETDAKRHWSVCRICGEKTAAEPHIPGAEATESQAQLCTVCGYELAPAQQHSHRFGPAWMYDGKTHWQACICGEQSVPAAHSWDDGTKNKDKTVTYICTQCLAEKTEKASGFPWWVLIILLLVAGGAGAAAYIYYVLPQRQTGKFISGREKEPTTILFAEEVTDDPEDY